MRVLIVRLGAFGDIIHTLPLAADLHDAGCSVDWLCEDRWACLLQGSPALRCIHQTPRRAWQHQAAPFARRLDDLRRLGRVLRRERYDTVIDAQGLAKSALLASLAGARRLVGHRHPRSREGTWLLPARRVAATATHVIDQQRALGLALLGHGHRRGPWRFPLPTWPESWLATLPVTPASGDWALNVGAGWPTKIWPEARQQAFARRCAEIGQTLWILWGSPAEEAVADRLLAAVPTARKAPPTNLPQLAVWLRRCALVVSGDTGPLHLALAVGTPAIGLFGPVPAERNGPRGPGYRTLQAPGRAWERHDPSLVAMDAISEDQVLAAAVAALAER